MTPRHKDGKLTDVLFNGSVFRNNVGEVSGVVIVARDVTDQKRIERELTEAKVFAELATGIAEEAKSKADIARGIAEEIETFVTGELCIQHLSHRPDVIILDYQLDGVDKNSMNGIETLDQIKAFDADTPVVILSAQDKIEVAVNCMHHKAFDYVVKSETAFIRLQKIITGIFLYRKMQKELIWYMERM